MDGTKEVLQVPIEDIIPNRFQPRLNFDEKALNELSSSIKEHGIIQPLVLRRLGDKYEIIAGERRYKAATLAGLLSVPAVVTEMDDNTSAEVALIENIQRKDLTSIEEAKSYKNVLDRGYLTQEQLAKKMGLSQSAISNKLRLLNLADEVQDALLKEKISERHARSLLSLNNKEEQVSWLNRIINERLTVRQLDLALKEARDSKMEENDIPIVDINPDIDNIINNAVDINPSVDNKPEVNVFAGILDDPEPTPANNEEINQPSQVPNKFFNFLEDEEVNMSMQEPTQQVVNEISSTQEDKTNNFFNFDIDNEPEEESLNISEPSSPVTSVPMEPEVQVENQQNPDFFNFNQNNVGFDQNIIEQPVTSEQPVISNEIISNNEPVSNQEEQNEFMSLNDAVNSIDDSYLNQNAQNNFFFTEQPVAQVEEQQNTSINEVQVPLKEEIINEPKIEPIPIVEGENIVDPVAYIDTLDPNYVENIKEMIGLDLKTAINAYRDITESLNANGFNVSIEELDMNDKYKIEIIINK